MDNYSSVRYHLPGVFPVVNLASYQVHIQVDKTRMTTTDSPGSVHAESQSDELDDKEMMA
jgi:hypothetical protein